MTGCKQGNDIQASKTRQEVQQNMVAANQQKKGIQIHEEREKRREFMTSVCAHKDVIQVSVCKKESGRCNLFTAASQYCYYKPEIKFTQYICSSNRESVHTA